MFGAIVAGIGILGGGAALGIRALHRRPVAADVAAQLKSALAGLNAGSTVAIDQLVTAYRTAKHPQTHQVEVVAKAAKLNGDKMGTDKVALYRATLATANPQQMLEVAKQLSSKAPVLATNLADVAHILGGK